VTEAERRARRRELVRRHHPDVGGDPDTFVEVLRALDPPPASPAGAVSPASGAPRVPGPSGPPRRGRLSARSARRRRQVLRRWRTRLPRRLPGARRYATY
jgi:hypothetical protein